MNLRDKILNKASARNRISVVICGEPCHVQEWSVAERDNFEAANQLINRTGEKGKSNFRARMIVASVVDDAGEKVFSPQDIEVVGNLANHEINEAVDKCMQVHGYTKADQADFEKKS